VLPKKGAEELGMSLSPLLPTADAAPLAGVAPKTLENWRTIGVGPRFIKAGRKVLYDPADLLAWRDQHRFGSTSEV
jgi:DNA-binding transcriptional MerR regulator